MEFLSIIHDFYKGVLAIPSDKIKVKGLRNLIQSEDEALKKYLRYKNNEKVKPLTNISEELKRVSDFDEKTLDTVFLISFITVSEKIYHYIKVAPSSIVYDGLSGIEFSEVLSSYSQKRKLLEQIKFPEHLYSSKKGLLVEAHNNLHNNKLSSLKLLSFYTNNSQVEKSVETAKALNDFLNEKESVTGVLKHLFYSSCDIPTFLLIEILGYIYDGRTKEDYIQETRKIVDRRLKNIQFRSIDKVTFDEQYNVLKTKIKILESESQDLETTLNKKNSLCFKETSKAMTIEDYIEVVNLIKINISKKKELAAKNLELEYVQRYFRETGTIPKIKEKGYNMKNAVDFYVDMYEQLDDWVSSNIISKKHRLIEQEVESGWKTVRLIKDFQSNSVSDNERIKALQHFVSYYKLAGEEREEVLSYIIYGTLYKNMKEVVSLASKNVEEENMQELIELYDTFEKGTMKHSSKYVQQAEITSMSIQNLLLKAFSEKFKEVIGFLDKKITCTVQNFDISQYNLVLEKEMLKALYQKLVTGYNRIQSMSSAKTNIPLSFILDVYGSTFIESQIKNIELKAKTNVGMENFTKVPTNSVLEIKTSLDSDIMAKVERKKRVSEDIINLYKGVTGTDYSNRLIYMKTQELQYKKELEMIEINFLISYCQSMYMSLGLLPIDEYNKLREII